MVMDGTAVFRRGEYAGELDEEATRGLLFGRGDLQTCTYPLSLPGTAEDPERLTVEVTSSKTKVRIWPEGEAAVIRLTISCKATVLEEYRAAGLESSDLKAVARRAAGSHPPGRAQRAGQDHRGLGLRCIRLFPDGEKEGARAGAGPGGRMARPAAGLPLRGRGEGGRG